MRRPKDLVDIINNIDKLKEEAIAYQDFGLADKLKNVVDDLSLFRQGMLSDLTRISHLVKEMQCL